MGYTSGVAENLYNAFKAGTYLVEEKKSFKSREGALEWFKEDYSNWTDNEDYFLSEEEVTVRGEDYSMYYDNDTNEATVYVEGFSFVNSLAEGGYTYTLTPEAQEYFNNGDRVSEDDFTSIRLAVAGEHLGDISVWYDIIKETVGGRDFEERSVSQYNGDIYDTLEEFKDYLIDEINQQNY